MSKQITIKDALIAQGVTEVAFATGGMSYATKIEDLPEETLLRIFDYGKRIFNDAVNGAVNQGKDRETTVQEWLAKAKDGNLGSRAGGVSRISPLAREIRNVVEDFLKAGGFKAGDAKKAATKPEEAFKELLALQIARGKGVPVAAVDEAVITAAFEKNWPMITERAQARVDVMKGDSFEVDID